MLACRQQIIIEYLMNPVLLIIFSIILGGVLVILLRPLAKLLVAKFKGRPPLIKRYWTYVVPLLLVTTIAYILVGIYARNEIAFGLVGQMSGLILAVFVGFIAFSEFGESKFDKLKEAGNASLPRDELSTAMLYFEEAHAIKPKEVNVLGNLLEMYVILGFYDKFDGKIKYYEKNVIEDADKLAVHYLRSLRYLFEQRIGDAEQHIALCVNHVKEKPKVRRQFTWRNRELKNSDAFKKLQSSTRKLIDNTFAFLKQELSNEDDEKFKSGNYELSK